MNDFMTDVVLRKSANMTWIVTATTERFGKDEIMYESWNRDDCIEYMNRNLVFVYTEFVHENDKFANKGFKHKNLSIKFRKHSVVASDGEYTEMFDNTGDATMWLWGMANNTDDATEFCHRFCDRFHCNVYGERNVFAGEEN